MFATHKDNSNLIMEEYSDIQFLIMQLNKGSEQAFDRIYKIYSPRVFSFALSLLSDRSEAEEIVQVIFIKIWDRRHQISVTGSFESYLFTMCKNAILNTIRTADYHRVFLDYKRYNPEPDTILDHELNCRELEELYKKAIDKLSPRKKEIFILNRTQALSHHEIAQKLGISIKTVRNQIDSASTEIKQLIGRLGYTGMLFLLIFVK
jgi:RNA polymerase sigma-70 factor, ECF subfamily